MTKKIIVTGCNGQLGRAVNQFYAGRDDISFVNTDVDELDISNVDAVMALAKEKNVEVFLPPLSLCGDNAAMIGSQAYYEFLAGNTADMSLNAYATKSMVDTQM